MFIEPSELARTVRVGVDHGNIGATVETGDAQRVCWRVGSAHDDNHAFARAVALDERAPKPFEKALSILGAGLGAETES